VHIVKKGDDMKVEGMDVVVDQYVGRLSHQEAYELAYELLRRAKQAWPYYVQTGLPSKELAKSDRQD
jgi:hypothetical protein